VRGKKTITYFRENKYRNMTLQVGRVSKIESMNSSEKAPHIIKSKTV
jgi:hypothetical protein